MDLGGFAGVGKVGPGGSSTDGINVHFVFRFVDLLAHLSFCSVVFTYIEVQHTYGH